MGVSICFSASFLPARSRFLQCDTVAGDIVIVRQCGKNLSVSVYINPPGDDFRLHVQQESTTAASTDHVDSDHLPEDEILLPQLVLAQLEVQRGDTVSLARLDEPPVAESMALREVLREGPATLEEERAATLEENVRSMFGLPTAASIARQRRQISALYAVQSGLDPADAIEASADVDGVVDDGGWLGEYLESQPCRYVPLAQGDKVAVSLDRNGSNSEGEDSASATVGPDEPHVVLEVVSTRPLGTVLVGPKTQLLLSSASPEDVE